jgi:hypothetical protein
MPTEMSDPLAIMSILKPKEPSKMHPYAIEALAEQRQQEVRRLSAESRRGPRWHLSWSKTTLASSDRRGSSLVIIISAHRPG